MNYYERHLGDYARDTGHLSLVEHGVYTLLLDRYYATEEGIPADQAYRVARARSDSEREAVDAVLAEFFVLVDGVWTQARAEQLIAEYREGDEEREAKRDNAKERKRRSRERRSQLFAELRGIGVVPPWDTAIGDLERLLSQGRSRVTGGVTGAAVTCDGTATQTPNTNTQKEQEQKHVQRSAARFPDFWAAYPVKKGKAAAEKAWKAKGCDANADQIIRHVQLMQASDDDWRRGYVPHGSTYVSGERWHDEPKRGPPQAGKSAEPSKTLSAIQQLEAMKHGLDDPRDHHRIPEAPLLELGQDSGHRPDSGDRRRVDGGSVR